MPGLGNGGDEWATVATGKWNGMHGNWSEMIEEVWRLWYIDFQHNCVCPFIDKQP